MKNTIDIVILEHSTGCVTVVKADQGTIEKKYDNNCERYISEFLQYKLSEISWMSGDKIRLEVFGGLPSGGLMVTNDGYWDN